MASIYKTIPLSIPASHAWDAVADFGALHTRLVRGFVTDTRLDGDTRDVSFANGAKARERVIATDAAHMRLAYTVVGGRASHYNASVQVLAKEISACEIIWIIDLLPDEMAAPISKMVDAGAEAMKRTLESM